MAILEPANHIATSQSALWGHLGLLAAETSFQASEARKYASGDIGGTKEKRGPVKSEVRYQGFY